MSKRVPNAPYKMILKTRPQGSDQKNLLANRISVGIFPFYGTPCQKANQIPQPVIYKRKQAFQNDM
jgi:hypothetical protein